MKKATWKRLCACLCALMLLLGTTYAEGEELSVVVPDGYAQGSGLPIYSAKVREQDFLDTIQPEWFNQSGIALVENRSKRRRYDHFEFEDEAQLTIDVEYISYEEYDGTFMQILGERPDEPDGPYPRESFACAIGELGSLTYFYGQGTHGQTTDFGFSEVSLEKTELAGITLEAAEAQVQALLSKLGMSGYEVSYALDMSVKHINQLGECYGRYQNDLYNKRAESDQWDFSKATEADEGYYLRLVKKLGGLPVWLADGGSFEATAFVNANGIRSFILRDYYEIGEVYEMPETLLTAEEAFARFEEGNAKRIKDGFLEPTLTGAELRYIPMRAANKKDGMVVAPAWYISYTFMDGGTASSVNDGWAWYSAQDGRLIQDCYSF